MMRFYVGTYSVPGSPGIALCELKDGKLQKLGATNVLNNPTYLIHDHAGKRLFAVGVNQDKAGVAAVFAIEGEQLQLLSTAPTGEGNACFLALNEAESTLYTANYHKGKLAVFHVEGNPARLERIQQVQHEGSGVNPERQEGPHVHHCAFRPGTNELFVCDLGIDRVVVHDTNRADGTVTQKATIPAPDGTGPRHLVFDGADRFYLAGELSSTVVAYAFENGAWAQKQVLTTLPEGEFPNNTCAAIRKHGNRLYVSNRGADNLAAYVIDAHGMLAPMGHIPSHGQSPRDFVVTDDGFLCANQVTGTVTHVAPDGTLRDSLSVPGAVCVCPM